MDCCEYKINDFLHRCYFILKPGDELKADVKNGKLVIENNNP